MKTSLIIAKLDPPCNIRHGLPACRVHFPVDQLDFFRVTPELWQRQNYVNPMILAVAATLLALALGAKSVLLMGNHGALVVGRTLPQAFERLYFLERAAQAQLLAMSTGKPLRLIPDAVVARVCAQMQGGGAVGGFEREELHFDALKRMLDRARMDYAS